MAILSTIAEKISAGDSKKMSNEELARPENEDIVIEEWRLRTYTSILNEVKKISAFMAISQVSKEKKDGRLVENNKVTKSLKKETKKPKEDGEKVLQEEAKAEKRDAAKVSSKKAAGRRKEKDAERIARGREKKDKVKEEVPKGPEIKEEEPAKEKGLLEGLIDMLKGLFMPIIAAGGIGVFLSGIFSMVLEGLGMGEEGGFFDTLTKTVKTITKPIIWTFENVIMPVGSIILTALKEFVLGIGQMWNEAKLFLMSNSPVAIGIRKLFNVKVDEKEKKELEKTVYEGRMRREERMAGYIEKVTGKRPGAPAQPPPRRVEVPPPIYLGTRTAVPPPSLVPAPTIAKPAPTPAVAAAAPPPAAKPPAAPPPATKPPAAAPAATPPAAAPGVPAPAAEGVQGLIIQSLKESGITDGKAIANILATVKAESNFKPKSENLNYTTAERIVQVFGEKRVGGIAGAQPLVKNPEALANKVYAKTDGNSTEGDGWKYRGRGFIQHTGKNQYKAISEFTGLDLVGNPDLLNDPGVAAKAIAWFFLKYKKLSVDQLSNMSAVNKAVAFSDPTGKKAAEREALASSMYQQMGSGTMVAQAPTTGQAVNVASAQVNSEKNRPRQPVVNVTHVDATRVTTATKTTYS